MVKPNKLVGTCIFHINLRPFHELELEHSTILNIIMNILIIMIFMMAKLIIIIMFRTSFNTKKITHRRVWSGDRKCYCLGSYISSLPGTLHPKRTRILLAIWISRELDGDTTNYSIHLVVHCCHILTCKNILYWANNGIVPLLIIGSLSIGSTIWSFSKMQSFKLIFNTYDISSERLIVWYDIRYLLNL